MIDLNSELSSLTALRSSELVLLAYEHGYFKNFEKLQMQAIEAALYKVKYSGCSIGFNEIKDAMSMVK